MTPTNQQQAIKRAAQGVSDYIHSLRATEQMASWDLTRVAAIISAELTAVPSEQSVELKDIAECVRQTIPEKWWMEIESAGCFARTTGSKESDD